MIQTFSTSAAPGRSQLAYWNRIHQQLRIPVVAQAVGADFDGRLTTAGVGPVRIAEHVSSAVLVRGTADNGFGDECSLHLLSDGVSRMRIDGRDITMHTGDVVLAHSQKGFEYESDRETATLTFATNHERIRPFVPDPAAACGIPIRAHDELGRLAGNLMTTCWSGLKAGMPQTTAGALIDRVFEAFAAALEVRENREQPAPAGRAVVREAEIRRFIERHLRSSDLTPGFIAKSLSITPRYVHMVFSQSGETVSRYILRRRLEEAALEIGRPARPLQSVTDIAISWGFRSLSHFAREFKRHFGLSPRDYRRQIRLPADVTPPPGSIRPASSDLSRPS